MIRKTPTGVQVDVRVIPRSPVTRLDGQRAGSVVIRLTAAPVEGAANDALIAFLAKQFSVPKRAVKVVAGDRSRQKTVAIEGLSEEAARATLERRGPE